MVVAVVGRVSSQLFGVDEKCVVVAVVSSVHVCCLCDYCWLGWRCRGDGGRGSLCWVNLLLTMLFAMESISRRLVRHAVCEIVVVAVHFTWL